MKQNLSNLKSSSEYVAYFGELRVVNAKLMH